MTATGSTITAPGSTPSLHRQPETLRRRSPELSLSRASSQKPPNGSARSMAFRSHEKDTLGRPADHAAKLAAAEDEAGIFLTETAQQRARPRAVRKSAGRTALDETYIRDGVRSFGWTASTQGR